MFLFIVEVSDQLCAASQTLSSLRRAFIGLLTFFSEKKQIVSYILNFDSKAASHLGYYLFLI